VAMERGLYLDICAGISEFPSYFTADGAGLRLSRGTGRGRYEKPARHCILNNSNDDDVYWQ